MIRWCLIWFDVIIETTLHTMWSYKFYIGLVVWNLLFHFPEGTFPQAEYGPAFPLFVKHPWELRASGKNPKFYAQMLEERRVGIVFCWWGFGSNASLGAFLHTSIFVCYVLCSYVSHILNCMVYYTGYLYIVYNSNNNATFIYCYVLRSQLGARSTSSFTCALFVFCAWMICAGFVGDKWSPILGPWQRSISRNQKSSSWLNSMGCCSVFSATSRRLGRSYWIFDTCEIWCMIWYFTWFDIDDVWLQ